MPERDLSAELAAVADELYRLPPDEFVVARDKRALDFRDQGDRRLADAVHQLHRPSQAAWLVNLLARERPRELDELLRLGADLRTAQEQLRGEELRELSGKRQRVVAALVGVARRLAHEARHPVRDRVAQEVETTLQAALADSQVASVVRAGRLTSTRRYAGFGTQPTSATEAAAGGTDERSTTARPKRRRIREWEWLAAGVREAEEMLRDAEAELVERESELTRADEEQNALHTRVVELTEQLERAEAKAADAQDRRRVAQETRDSAVARAEAARRDLEAARGRLAAAGARE